MCESHVSDCVRGDWAGKAMCVSHTKRLCSCRLGWEGHVCVSHVSDCVRGDRAGKAMCVSQT